MTTSIFETHKEKILNKFKDFFIENLSKGILLSFDDLQNKALFSIGLPKNYTQTKQIKYLAEWYEKIIHFKFLEKLIDRDDLNEAIFHGADSVQIQARHETKSLANEIYTDDEILYVWQVLCLTHKQRWNFSRPFVSFKCQLFQRTYRLTLSHPSISSNHQAKAFFRLLSEHEIFKINNFTDKTQQIDQIRELVYQKKNIIISGPTGSGKTSFMSSLLSEVPNDEHLIVLEDVEEVPKINKSWTYLISKEEEKKSLTDYCAYALRMKPDRILLGEIRSKEIVPFVLSMNTGHKGLISTLHANSAKDSISRLTLLFSLFSNAGEVPYSTIQKMICQSIDYVIYVEDKRIKEIVHVLGSNGETPFLETIT